MTIFTGVFIFCQHLSHITRKPAFCICENKGADQLCSNCIADQRLCFRYLVSTCSQNFKHLHVACFSDCTRSQTLKTAFLTPRLVWHCYLFVLIFNVLHKISVKVADFNALNHSIISPLWVRASLGARVTCGTSQILLAGVSGGFSPGTPVFAPPTD